jgi:hypothetical protein
MWVIALRVPASEVMEVCEEEVGCRHMPYLESKCYRRDALREERFDYEIRTRIEEGEDAPDDLANLGWAYVCLKTCPDGDEMVALPTSEQVDAFKAGLAAAGIVWREGDFGLWCTDD